jgi:hypothetical protein
LVRISVSHISYSSQSTFVFFRYEHPTGTVKEQADSKLPWVNVQEAWVWSILDNDVFASKMLVKHLQVHTEEDDSAVHARKHSILP